MEAGAAGPQDTTQAVPMTADTPPAAPATQSAVDSQQTGNGIVVIAGQFEARSIAKCYHLPNEGTLRAEGGTLVGEREVDDNELVGFDGLIVGDKYIVACYSRGRYEEVRCAAVDPEAGLTLIQQPIQPSPNTLGTQGTHVIDSPAAESEGASELEEGLPEGVTSPVLGGDTPSQGDPTAAEDAQISPGDISGAETVAPGVAPSSQEGAAKTDEEARTAQEPAAVAAGNEPTVSPVDQPNPPAPDAGTPNASDSSGTGQANGGAVEQTSEAAPVTAGSVTVETTTTATPSAPADTPAEAPATGTDAQGEQNPSAQPSDGTPAPAADAPASEPATPIAGESSSAPAPTPALVSQAEGLGVENASTLSDDELRQAITEKQATPVV
jgi:hypothetical protein